MAEYSDGLIVVWHIAALEAQNSTHAAIEPGHFFVALCKACDLSLVELMKGSPEMEGSRGKALEAEIEAVRRAFHAAGLDATRFRRRLRIALGRPGETPADGAWHRSPVSRRLCDLAEQEAHALSSDVIHPVHMLLALAEMEAPPWAPVLEHYGIAPPILVQAARDVAVKGDVAVAPPPVEQKAPERQSRPTPLLDRYGRDLTKLATEGKLPPMIGRREELRRLGRVLLQQGYNNAILIGEAGVGKTAVVEGLAQRIAQPNVIPEMRGKRIVELSMGVLVAGTKYRGEFEERLLGMLEEARAPEIILFIDEIHMMVKAGSGEGAMDAANIMKPALARGDIRCIGAATDAEYRRHIQADPALDSRFAPIQIEEPTRSEAIEILRGIRPTLEQHHRLQIKEEAIEAAVDLSTRYEHEERQPRKAKKLLDGACARVRLESFTERGWTQIVDRSHVEAEASALYKRPIAIMHPDEAARLLTMEAHLRQRIKGQEEAVSTVAKALRKTRAGMKRPNRPAGVFLFLGPTGTGKTELAKATAEFLFGDEGRLIREDMSEYADSYAKSRLLGAPPGYIGHDQEPRLLAEIRKQPYSVVLLDEIEKAHREIHQLFLQVFDEGRLTDTHGRTASFCDAVIIMTSNLGAVQPQKPKPMGIRMHEDVTDDHLAQEQFRENTINAVKAALLPELFNRIQNLVFFHPLNREAIRAIIDKIVADLTTQLADRSLTLTLADSAYDLLMSEGYDEAYGAREMERAAERLIAEPLGSLLLAGKTPNGAQVYVRAAESEMAFDII